MRLDSKVVAEPWKRHSVPHPKLQEALMEVEHATRGELLIVSLEQSLEQSSVMFYYV